MKKATESKTPSRFRLWIRNIWFENIDERSQYREMPYTMEEYWSRYKWWLKREYQYQRKQGNE